MATTRKHNSTSNLKRHKAVAALLIHGDVKSAARSAGIGERTLHRWLKEDPAFQAEVHTAEAEAVATAVRRLTGITDEAVAVFQRVLRDPGAHINVKLRTAAIILNQLPKLRELLNLEQRVAKLEEEYNSTLT